MLQLEVLQLGGLPVLECLQDFKSYVDTNLGGEESQMILIFYFILQ